MNASAALRSLLAGLILAAIVFWLPQVSLAEKPSILRAEAYPGHPFGVGKITFRMGQAGKLIQHTGAVRLSDRDRRVFYPAFSEGLLSMVFDRKAVGGVQSVWFLFRGDAPLQVTLHGDESETLVVDMNRRRPAISRMVFQGWWRQFNAQARQRVQEGDYPPLVETYLTSMLGRRLNLPTPVLDRMGRGQADELQQTVNLLFDVESIRADSIRQLMNQPRTPEVASLTLPPPPVWTEPPLLHAEPRVETEPIARFVPEECFYLRFGNWNNQLWLKRLMSEYGGDLSRMISLRGHRTADTGKMLDQLVLETSQIDDWFGGNLIADVAAIGTDLYVNDGPANAILMLAKNGSLEGRVRSRRQKYARDHAADGVTLSEIEIAGRQVTLLSTPDHRIRSFYAVEDLCHITSSSRTVVERFFQSADGQGSLANNAEFRMARRALPLERDDTVFIYLSRAFFENLLGPRYQIELARRNRSLANIQLLQMAQWAAVNEGIVNDDIDQMIAHGLLPQNYNQLPDGSFCSWKDDEWHDSLRGRRGYFLPIPDVRIDAITPAESAWLDERLEFYRQELKSVDPLLIAFKRFELSDQVERIVIDARVAPFGKEKYGWLGDVLGPPLEFEVDMGPESLISIQASIAGNMFSQTGLPHQIFASVQGDVPPKTDLQPANFFELLDLVKTTPGYLGAWPRAGYLDMLPALGSRPDVEGFTYSRILDIWRLQHGEFSLISFDRHRLQQARDMLALVPAERPAQVRLRVGDIASSNLRQWANVLYFERSRETSIANVRLLNLMIQQFNLDPATALAHAEQLLGVRLTCPLEGEYHLAATDGDRQVWQSTRWPPFEHPVMPENFTAPPMNWFRGLSLDVYQRSTRFVVHGYLDIARDPSSFGSGGSRLLDKLPSINMFRGFSRVEELPPALESEEKARRPNELPEGKRAGDDKSSDDELLAPPESGKGESGKGGKGGNGG